MSVPTRVYDVAYPGKPPATVILSPGDKEAADYGNLARREMITCRYRFAADLDGDVHLDWNLLRFTLVRRKQL